MSFITDKQLTDMPSIELKSFHIKNYKGIIDTKVENIPSGTQWIFLTGENGFGKTSVLQAFVEYTNTFMSTKDSYLHFLHHKDEIYITPPRRLKEYLIDRYEYEPLIYSMIGYGSSRLRVSDKMPIQLKDVFGFSNKNHSLFSNDVLLINIEERLKDWYLNYKKGFQKLEELFKCLLPNLDKIIVEFDEIIKASTVKYFEKDVENSIYDGVTFEELAAGYKNIIAIVGDMVYRFSLKQDVEDYKDLEGIVLIDEFELHLHPKYQKLFVEKLTELFPKIQFIVSTHSPIPLLGAPANSVIINVTRTKEEGIQAKLLDIDFSVLTPNTILSSPIFGFQDLIPDSKSNDKMIRTEDTYKEVLFHDQLDKQIDEFLTDDRKQELLDLLKEK